MNADDRYTDATTLGVSNDSRGSDDGTDSLAVCESSRDYADINLDQQQHSHKGLKLVDRDQCTSN